jgi:hypothetical protein
MKSKEDMKRRRERVDRNIDTFSLKEMPDFEYLYKVSK